MKKHIKSIREDISHALIHIIIPSAGIGRRMKSYGCKSLLNINHEKLIDIQIKNIRQAFPENEIILITGFDRDWETKIYIHTTSYFYLYQQMV